LIIYFRHCIKDFQNQDVLWFSLFYVSWRRSVRHYGGYLAARSETLEGKRVNRNGILLMVDALKILIEGDQDFAIEALPCLEMLLRHGITLCERVKGIDEKYYQDPSFLQYAVVAGKTKMLRCLLTQSLKFAISFESVFNPRGSNTKRDLLTLAAGLPRVAVIDTILEFMKAEEHSAYVGDIKAWLNFEGPAQTTPLLVAIELGNWDAVKSLVRAGADLLKEPRYRQCPLVVILKKDAARLMPLTEIEGVSERLAHAIPNSQWDDHAMLTSSGGKALRHVLSRNEESWTSEVQAVLRKYDQEIGSLTPVAILDPKSELPSGQTSLIQVCFKCKEANVQLNCCPLCDEWFCEPCFELDDHNCPNK
jgi:ankyrin repeat protein